MTPRVNAIKDAIRLCKTVDAVNEVVKEVAAEVAEMDRQGGEARVAAIHIRNLATWKRADIGARR